MAYSINNLKEALSKLPKFVDIIVSNGYVLEYGDPHSMGFIKNAGEGRMFHIFLYGSLSGYVSCSLSGLKNSDTYAEHDRARNKEWVSCEIHDLDSRIKFKEEKILKEWEKS